MCDPALDPDTDKSAVIEIWGKIEILSSTEY